VTKIDVERGRLVLAGALACFACGDPLAFAQDIESTRVLGARLELADDPTRAWPRPGEAATLRWLVADPRPAPPLGWTLSACVGTPTARGVPTCRDPAFTSQSSAGLAEAPPVLAFTMPDAGELGGTDRVLVTGAICADAEPVVSTPLERTSCDGDLSLVAFDVGIERNGAANRQPTLSDELITLDGVEWLEPDAALLASEGCSNGAADPGLPTVSSGSNDHRITISLSPDDREGVPGLGGPSFETLQLSHFSSAGRLTRPISIVEADAPVAELAVGWKAPGSAAAARVVRFYFVVRDLRGGVDWALRTLCLVP
jgi:hypothetical protein